MLLRLPMILLLLFITLPLQLSALAAEPLTEVKLTSGQIASLSDIGCYRLGYKMSSNKSEQLMPDGWVGHFEAKNGISYCPFGEQGGKSVLLMHAPWRIGSGVTFAEYQVSWPSSEKLKLIASTAMKQDVVGKSDGVEFRVYVDGKQVLSHLQSSSDWKYHSIEVSSLSKERGRALVRLEVSPGPKGNASFDYSFWGDPSFVVSGLKKGETKITPAYSKKVKLPDMTSVPGKGTQPSSDMYKQAKGMIAEGDNRFTLSSFNLAALDEKDRVDYIVEPKDSFLSGIKAVVGGKVVIPICVGGEIGGASSQTPTTLVSASMDEGWLHLKYSAKGKLISVKLNTAGKSLVIEAKADPGIGYLDFGRIGAVPWRKSLFVPYLDNTSVSFLRDASLFVASDLDWTMSNATYIDGSRAYYAPKTDKSQNAVIERAYVTISQELGEVLPNIPHEPSMYIKDLSRRIVIDSWGQDFGQMADLLRQLRSYGVLAPALIVHVWQRDGYDNGLPNHFPTSGDLGGPEALVELSRVAKATGARLSLHENYIDMYPNSDYYNLSDVAKESTGVPQKAWYNLSTEMQSYAITPSSYTKYAKLESPKIHSAYGTNSSYLDVHSSVRPWFHVDMDSTKPLSGSMQGVIQGITSLFDVVKDTHGGPLLGEGSRHMYWAGLVDGVEAQVEGGENAPLILDFDLLKIHNQMVNHGMGYYVRWWSSGDGEAPWGIKSQVPAVVMDKYRATEVAYGHAGFVGSELLGDLPFIIKEHYLVSPIQARYATATPISILYEDKSKTGGFGSLAEVLTAGGALTGRVRVDYSSGLSVWVNRNPKNWVVTTPAGRITLPPYGWHAQGPGVVSGTRLWGKYVGDFSLDGSVLYVDGRGRSDIMLGHTTEAIELYGKNVNIGFPKVDFGPVITSGAVVMRPSAAPQVGIRIVPVPRDIPISITIRVNQAAAIMTSNDRAPLPTIQGVVSRDSQGKTIDEIPYTLSKDRKLVTFAVGGDLEVYDYLLKLKY